MNYAKRPVQLTLDMNADAEIKPRVGRDIDIDPVDATFRDSARAPLHSWFPYLEGYSPRFVESVRAEYMPAATRIIEPFAGSGTTPIVLGQAGIACAYSEANPAMAFIVRTKLAVLGSRREVRLALSDDLRRLAATLADRLSALEPDAGLRSSYIASFGKSIFFADEALETILRLRTLCDEVSSESTLLGDCLLLAVLAVLIPCSHMKRAGDLRFKTPKELAAGVPNPIAAVVARLIDQASDLSPVIEIKTDATFACDSAGDLASHLDGSWDGVITSPPYLNGTNYIRNARLELWFLRRVREKIDLRRLRDRVITSGINDVDVQTQWQPVTDGVARVVAELQEKAYDERIAKMVGGYFFDMAAVLRALQTCVRDHGRLCIDIGDSIYAGVHVATDDLLVEIAEDIGFRTVERLHLRKRMSKSGVPVRQQLLVFERSAARPRLKLERLTDDALPSKPPVTATLKQGLPSDWVAKWAAFKETLPHQSLPYSQREWGGPAHSMCSYQGKMKPALAHHLINCFSSEGDIVVDPFSGAGTIPFEACRMGRRGYGVDISALGHVLTFAKVAATSPEAVDALLLRLERFLSSYQLSTQDTESASAVRFNSAVPDYFHPETFREVMAARRFFQDQWNSSPEWALLLASTLHLLHGNRPYALSRRSHPVTPFKPTGPFEYRALMPRLREKLARMSAELWNGSRKYGGSSQGDCTATWPSIIPKADVVLTSPPFFDSTRFYMTNWMRFWFVGWERSDFDSKPVDYVESRQKQNLDVYVDFFAASRERIKDRGLLVLHLGYSTKCDMGTELTSRTGAAFEVMDCFTEGVEHCESHGIRDKGTVSGHTYLVLRAR